MKGTTTDNLLIIISAACYGVLVIWVMVYLTECPAKGGGTVNDFATWKGFGIYKFVNQF